MKKQRYTINGRLEDILALIQVLALHEHSHRSDGGLQNELPEKPKSSESWLTLADEHFEFFRVVERKTNSISLVARHLSLNENKKRPPLSSQQTETLLNTAIELHDRQIKRENQWAIYIPIWVAAIGGLITVIKFLIENSI